MAEQDPKQAENRDGAGKFRAGRSGNPAGRPRRDAAERSAEARLDGFINTITGLGTSRDKRLGGGAFDRRGGSSLNFVAERIGWDMAREIWAGDDLAARVIETIPDEMLREGWQLTIGDDDVDAPRMIDEVRQKCDDLGLDAYLWECLAFERAYGGGALFLGANDGEADLTVPLNLKKVRSLDYLTPLEPRECVPLFYFQNWRAPKFSLPAIYQVVPIVRGAPVDSVNTPLLSVHESRLVRFPGTRVSRAESLVHGGWGESLLTRVGPVLRDAELSWGAAGALVADFSQAVLQLEGLEQALAADDGGAQFQARLTAMDIMRSTLRMMVIGKNDVFKREPTPVSGLPELLDRFMLRLSAASRIPYTILMGQSPAGLSATGDSDIRNFYDHVASMQRRRLRPAIRQVIGVVMQVLFGDRAPRKWDVEFKPLWQPTEKEVAETRYLIGQTDALYLDRSVYSAEECATSHWGGSKFSPDIAIDFDAREALEPAAEAPVDIERLRHPESGGPGYEPPPAPGTKDPVVPVPAPGPAAAADPRTPPMPIIGQTQDRADFDPNLTGHADFDPDQPRASDGKFGEGGGGGGHSESGGSGGADHARVEHVREQWGHEQAAKEVGDIANEHAAKEAGHVRPVPSKKLESYQSAHDKAAGTIDAHAKAVAEAHAEGQKLAAAHQELRERTELEHGHDHSPEVQASREATQAKLKELSSKQLTSIEASKAAEKEHAKAGRAAVREASSVDPDRLVTPAGRAHDEQNPDRSPALEAAESSAVWEEERRAHAVNQASDRHQEAIDQMREHRGETLAALREIRSENDE